MYLDFFGLTEMPFNITPDPRFLYFTDKHRRAYDHLLYGINHRKGFIQLVGEVGSGKTTLCRAVLSELTGTIETALILNPCLTETQLLRAILNDLGHPAAGRDRLRLIEQLNEFLLQKSSEGINVAIIIDEAQDLSPTLMEQVRLLSNLETDQHKLMQIVLSGQPELNKRLRDPSLRQLRQRIMVKCELETLTMEETNQYIQHRLHYAGGEEDVFFDVPAVKLVYKESKGTPRLVNKICDLAMLAGFANGTRSIGSTEVKQSIKELEGLT